MLRRLTMVAIPLAACIVVGILSCATGPRPLPKYPPRRPGCALSIFHTDLPQVTDWDELGNVEIICHIDDTDKTCFARLRAEVCRMGGDIIYHLPVKPWRPREEALGFRAKVAHSRHAPEKDARPVEVDPTLPPPASPEESAGPVVPLTGLGAPPSSTSGVTPDADGSTDGGAGNADGRRG